jgi:uncharacterized protein (DUF2164 family)
VGSKIEIDKHTREAMVQALSRYLKAELDVEVTGFDAQFLLDFIGERFGPLYYNQGLYDAQTVLRDRLEQAADAVLALEQSAKL